ncbi:MAG: glycosyltransferase family 4 protein [Candidatus Aureabacteria bacterium]|nr:glycosyltransferase family 4 protein [Candidatus Auribacterota bacterium]
MSRIVFIDLLFNWPPDGGARVDLKEIMSRLSDSHDVTLLVPDFPDYFPRGRIKGDFPFKIITLPFTKWTFNAWHLPRIFKDAVGRLKPDHVFIGDGWYLKFPLAAALRDYHPILRFYAYEGLCIKDYGTQFRYGKICPKNYLRDTCECTRCSLAHHRFFSPNMFSQEFLAALAFTPIYKSYVLRAIRAASAIVVYNKYIRDALSPYHPNVRTIPSGVDTERFAAVSRTRKREGITILMTSRTGDEGKGFKVLREAVGLLKARGKKFTLLIPTYGSGEPADDAIEYLPWHSQEELPNLYAQADICVVPSIWREPFGIAAVEAMAAGKPVVASRVGGLEEIVDHGVTGFLVEPGNAGEVAESIKKLLDDPELRMRMGEAGRERGKMKFAWKKIIEDYYFPLFT